MPYSNRRGGGGAGFTLGPPDNLFGTTAGNASQSPLTITPAANRAAAETVRDTYFTANPSNLAAYNSNPALGVIIYFRSGSDIQTIGQTRTGGEWRDSNSVVAIQGLSGDAASLDGVSVGHVPVKLANDTFGDSGVEILSSGTVKMPGATLGIGDLLELSEGTGFGLLHNNVTNASFILIDAFLSETTGSGRPQQFVVATPSVINFQSDSSTPITANPHTFNYSVTVDGATFSIDFTTLSEMPNAKFRIRDSSSGVAFKYIPSEMAWNDDLLPGLNLRSGVNTLNFFSSDPDDPANGQFNVGYTPLLLDQGRQLTFDIKADSVNFAGNSSGVPAFSGNTGLAEFKGLAYREDIVISDWETNDENASSFIRNKPLEFLPEVEITSSESPYLMELNTSIVVALNGQDVIVNIPDGESGDGILISGILLVGGNKLILRGSGFTVVDLSGAVVASDTELHLTENRRYKLLWHSSNWRLQLR